MGTAAVGRYRLSANRLARFLGQVHNFFAFADETLSTAANCTLGVGTPCMVLLSCNRSIDVSVNYL